MINPTAAPYQLLALTPLPQLPNPRTALRRRAPTGEFQGAIF